MSLLETFADFVNNALSPLMPFVEKYWLYLLAVPLIPIIWAIAHYIFGVI